MSYMVIEQTVSVARHFARRLRWGTGAVALALAVAGCGGGGGDGGGASTTAPVAAQLNPVEAFALAQQSLLTPDDAAPTPAASANMLSNPGFESGMTNWADWGNANVVSGQASSGTSALSVGIGAGGAGQRVAGIVPGNTYRLTAQARVSAASETVYVGVNFVDEQGIPFTQNSVLVTGTNYTTASLEVVAPANAASALVYVWKNAGSGIAVVDDFALQSLGRATPRLPSSVNLVFNGNFEGPFASLGWVNWGNADFLLSAAQAAAGSFAVRVGTGAGGAGANAVAIVAGNTYRVSALARVSDPNEIGYFGVMFMDDAGNGRLAQNVVFRSTTYSAVQADVTAPAGATKAQVFVWKNAGSGYAFVDEVSLVQVAPVSSFFTPVSASPTVLANTTTTARDVAVLKSGTRVAAWSDAAGVHTQRIDARGSLVGSAMMIAPSGSLTGLAALAGGGYVVQYTVPGAVLAQIVDATGALAGAPVVVRTQAQVDADPGYEWRDQARLAGGAGVYPNPDGGFIAGYRESHTIHNPQDRPIAVFAQRYDALGSPVGGPRFIGDDGITAIAPTPAGGLITGGLFFCGCAGSGRASFSVYDSSLAGRSLPVNSALGFIAGSASGAGMANGAYVAIWTLSGQVQGQIFAPSPAGGFEDVTPRAPLTSVMTFPNAGAGARVTALAGGGFLVSWGNSAQAFSGSGFPVSEVVQILDGSIAAMPEGGFVVVAQVGSQLVAQQYVLTH